jgi:hypothetical protein
MDCWERLAIDATSNTKDIKRAYAKQLKQCHPEDQPEEFQTLNLAYKEALQLAKGNITRPEPEILQVDLDRENEQAPTDNHNDNIKLKAEEFLSSLQALLQHHQQRTDKRAWDILLEVPELRSMEFRQLISNYVFYIIAEHFTRQDINVYIPPSFIQRLIDLFNWGSNELELARNFSADAIDLVMNQALPINSKPSEFHLKNVNTNHQKSQNTKQQRNRPPAKDNSRVSTAFLYIIAFLFVIQAATKLNEIFNAPEPDFVVIEPSTNQNNPQANSVAKDIYALPQEPTMPIKPIQVDELTTAPSEISIQAALQKITQDKKDNQLRFMDSLKKIDQDQQTRDWLIKSQETDLQVFKPELMAPDQLNFRPPNEQDNIKFLERLAEQDFTTDKSSNQKK